MELNALSAEQIIKDTCAGSSNTIDLTKCTFVEVSGIIRLVLLARHLTFEKRSIQMMIPQSEDVQGYLERANVFNELKGYCTFNESIEHLQHRERNPTSTLVELRSLDEENQARAIIDCFSTSLKAHKSINSDIMDTIDKVLFETLQNISEHANPGDFFAVSHGLAALQRYKKKLCLSIGDLGVGIRKSLTSNPKYPESRYDHTEAIKAAISGYSRHADIGRGGGLMSVVAAIQKLDGWLKVRSGDVAVTIAANDQQRVDQYVLFPGTQIDINVPLLQS